MCWLPQDSVRTSLPTDVTSPQLEPTAKGSERSQRRSLRPTPKHLEIENLLTYLCGLDILTESEFFVPVILERALHNCLFSSTLESTDSSFANAALASSTPQQNPSSSRYRSPGLSLLSSVTPSTSPSSSEPSDSSPTPLETTLLPLLSYLFDLSLPPIVVVTNPLPSGFTTSTLTTTTVSSNSLSPAPVTNHPINPPINPRPHMANPVLVQMPLHRTPNVLKFNGKIPSELLCYLEDIELLSNVAIFTIEQKIKVTLRYAVLDEAKVWQMLPKATVVPANWDTFITAVKKNVSWLQRDQQI